MSMDPAEVKVKQVSVTTQVIRADGTVEEPQTVVSVPDEDEDE